MTKVCIAIPVHAEPERLLATLASVRANTGADFQLVLLPDGADHATTRALANHREIPQLVYAMKNRTTVFIVVATPARILRLQI